MPKPPTDDAGRHALRAQLMRTVDRYVETFGPEATRRALIGVAIVVESIYALEPLEEAVG